MRHIFALVILAGTAGSAVAEDIGYSAGQMWGTDPSGVAVGGAVKSSSAHLANGIVAGQVNAARNGVLLESGVGSNITIQSIGSQTVVSTSIIGNDNDADITATQTSENSGDVSNQGTVNTQ